MGCLEFSALIPVQTRGVTLPSMPCQAQGPLPDVQVQLVCVDILNFTAENTEKCL